MWIAPPSGLRFISAPTTPSVSLATSSRTRADAAPWPPLMARTALVMAIEIFAGSNVTTAPLRRITLYCAKRGSALAGVALPGSPAMWSRVGDGVAAAEALVSCMGRFSCRILSLSWRRDARRTASACCGPALPGVGFPGDTGPFPKRRMWRHGVPVRPVLRKLLENQNLLHLVFKCRVNTKSSERLAEWQDFFRAPGGSGERVEPVAGRRDPRLSSRDDPPAIHRVAHSQRADERRRRCCRFATGRGAMGRSPG